MIDNPEPPPYDYWPIKVEDQRHKYCGAPRHQMTRVKAKWVEKFILNMPDKFMDGEYLACDDCHEETLRNYLDAMLPELTDEELSALPDEIREDYLSGKYNVPDGPYIPPETGVSR